MHKKNERDPLVPAQDDTSPSILPFPDIRSAAGPRRRRPRSGYYIIPPSDINVRKVEVAAVKKRDMRNFLHYRLRSLYPANSDLTAFDYLLPESDGERDALLCICRSDVLSKHREAAGGRQIGVPLSLLMPVIGSYREAKLAFLYFGEASVEIDLFEQNHLVSSTVYNRGDGSQDDAIEVDRVCGDFGAEALYSIVEKSEDTAAFKICKELDHGSRNMEIADLESALRALPRRSPLFQASRKKSNARWRIAAAALTAAALVLGVFVADKAVQRELGFAAYLDVELESAQQQAEYALRLEEEVTALRVQIDELARKPSVQPYLVLSELGEILKGQARIDTFFVEGSFFQIDAVSVDPLTLMQQFEARPFFRDLRIAEVVQVSGSNRKRFTLTGEYDGG